MAAAEKLTDRRRERERAAPARARAPLSLPEPPEDAAGSSLMQLRAQVENQDYRAFIRAGAEIERVEGQVASVKGLLYRAEDALVTLENVALDLGEAAASAPTSTFGPGALSAGFGGGGFMEEAPSTDLAVSPHSDFGGLEGLGGGGFGGPPGGAGGGGGLRLPQWLQAAPEELEEFVLERQNKAAEGLVLKVRQFEAQIHDPNSVNESLREVFEKVRRGAHALATRLLKEVKVGAHRGSQVWGFRAQEQTYRLLITLGYGEAAAGTFLENRRKEARHALSVVDVGSDFSQHVHVLCRSFVGVLRAATLEFSGLFAAPASRAGFSHAAAPSQHMAWVDAELEYFCSLVGQRLLTTLQASPGGGAAGDGGSFSFDMNPYSTMSRGVVTRAHTLTRDESLEFSAGPRAAHRGSVAAPPLGGRGKSGVGNALGPGGRKAIGTGADGAARRRRATAVTRRRSMLRGPVVAGVDQEKSQADAVRRALLALEVNVRPLTELGLLLWPRMGMLLLPHLRDFFAYRVRRIVAAAEVAVAQEGFQVYENTITAIPFKLFGPFSVDVNIHTKAPNGDFYTVTGNFLRSTATVARYIAKFLEMASGVLDLAEEDKEDILTSQPLYPLVDDVIAGVLEVLKEYMRLLEDAVSKATPEDQDEMLRSLSDGVTSVKTILLPKYAHYKDTRQEQELLVAMHLEEPGDAGGQACSVEAVEMKMDELTAFLSRAVEI